MTFITSFSWCMPKKYNSKLNDQKTKIHCEQDSTHAEWSSYLPSDQAVKFACLDSDRLDALQEFLITLSSALSSTEDPFVCLTITYSNGQNSKFKLKSGLP